MGSRHFATPTGGHTVVIDDSTWACLGLDASTNVSIVGHEQLNDVLHNVHDGGV